MSIAHAMLGEFEHESKITQKFLERVPQNKLGWKPHEKSHTAGAGQEPLKDSRSSPCPR